MNFLTLWLNKKAFELRGPEFESRLKTSEAFSQRLHHYPNLR